MRSVSAAIVGAADLYRMHCVTFFTRAINLPDHQCRRAGGNRRIWFPQVREELAQFVPQIAHFESLEWVEVPEACNWKVPVDNYPEYYHCKLNHRTFATCVVKPKTDDIQAQGYCLWHTTECQNPDKMTYPSDLNANPFTSQYSYWYLWPLFSFQVYPGNLLNTCHRRTVDAGNVALWRGWYTVSGEESATIRELAVQDLQTTVAEDIGLVGSGQARPWQSWLYTRSAGGRPACGCRF